MNSVLRGEGARWFGVWSSVLLRARCFSTYALIAGLGRQYNCTGPILSTQIWCALWVAHVESVSLTRRLVFGWDEMRDTSTQY
jgi:hypothetical protein